MNASAAASRSSVLTPGRTRVRISARVPATIRPARAMMSTSRGDLRVTIATLVPQGLSDAAGDFLYTPNRGHPPDSAARLVPGEHRRGLLPVGAEAGRHRRRVVVNPAFDFPPIVEARQNLLVGDVEEQHRVHPAAPFGEEPRHPLRLRDGAHHAVEDDPLGRLGLGQLVAHYAEDEVVAHQVAGLHQGLGLQAERGAPLHRVAEEVAGGELGNAEGFSQDAALGALPGTRRAHEEDVHARLAFPEQVKGKGERGRVRGRATHLPSPFPLSPLHPSYIYRCCRPRNLTRPVFMKPSYFRRVRCCSTCAMVSSRTPTTIRTEVPPNWETPTPLETRIGTRATKARNKPPGRVTRANT